MKARYGRLVRVTRDLATEVFPSISANQRLVFSSDRSSGRREIWAKDLALGTDTMLAVSQSEFDSPKITPDGSKVAYAGSNPDWAIHVVSSTGGDEKIYKNGGPPRDFSSDGTKLLFEAKILLALLRGTSGFEPRQDEGTDPEFQAGALSGIVFTATASGSRSRPGRWTTIRPGRFTSRRSMTERSAAQDTWIAVTDGNHMDREVRWSPDGGRSISCRSAMASAASGASAWTGRPSSRRRTVPGLSFPSFAAILTNLGSPGKVGLSVTRDGLLFSLAETTGNIWMARRRR